MMWPPRNNILEHPELQYPIHSSTSRVEQPHILPLAFHDSESKNTWYRTYCKENLDFGLKNDTKN